MSDEDRPFDPFEAFDLDTSTWPWREAHWLWCHPLTTMFMLLWPITTAIWAVWDVTHG